MESTDDYTTTIYNDEVHQYDEVIDTIRLVLDCDMNTAIGLTTLIDRKGRCVIKCSGHDSCQKVCLHSKILNYLYLKSRIFFFINTVVFLFKQV